MRITFIGVKIYGAFISVMLTSSLLRNICYLFISLPTFFSLPPCNQHSCFNLVLLFLQQRTKIAQLAPRPLVGMLLSDR